MRKLILPISLLLLVAFVVGMFGRNNCPALPESKEVSALNGRLTLKLPGEVKDEGALEECIQGYSCTGCTVQVVDVLNLASADFPETEDFIMKKMDGSLQARHEGDLHLYTRDDFPYSARALVRHTDGSLLMVTVETGDWAEKNPELAREMVMDILKSAKPGPRKLELGAHEEELTLPGSRVTVKLPVPEGYVCHRSTYDEDALHADEAPATRPKNPVLSSNLRMGPVTQLNRDGIGTGVIRISLSNTPLPMEGLDKLEHRAGTLLGRQVDWSIEPLSDNDKGCITTLQLEDGVYLSILISATGSMEDVEKFIQIVEKLERK